MDLSDRRLQQRAILAQTGNPLRADLLHEGEIGAQEQVDVVLVAARDQLAGRAEPGARERELPGDLEHRHVLQAERAFLHALREADPEALDPGARHRRHALALDRHRVAHRRAGALGHAERGEPDHHRDDVGRQRQAGVCAPRGPCSS
jgi:hypothetical protein